MPNLLFLEPGGDPLFNVAKTTDNPPGFWTNSNSGGFTLVSDFVHLAHQKSLQGLFSNSTPKSADWLGLSQNGRMSFWVYIVTMPTADNSYGLTRARIFQIIDNPFAQRKWSIFLRSTGAFYLADGIGAYPTTQIGSDSATINTGEWHRISIAWTWTSNTVNAFKFWLDGTLVVSTTNTNLGSNAPGGFLMGPFDTWAASIDMRFSDIYADDSNALTDIGNVVVVAQRPKGNGTTNGFTGQGTPSGYGTGNARYVNERPLSTSNYVSVVGAGSAVTEEYNLQGQTEGDIDISSSTILDYMGWVCAKALASETAKIILNNVLTNISLTSTIQLFTKAAGSATYPAGTGTDIGIQSSTTVTTVSLYECGVIVAVLYTAAPKTATLSEATTMSDTLIKVPKRTLSEATSLAGTLIKMGNKVLSEATTMSAVLIKIGQKVLSEATTMSAVLIKIGQKVLSEASTISDTFVKLTQRLLSEASTLTDTLIKLPQRILTEASTLSDTFIFLKLKAFTYSEASTISDTFVKMGQKVLSEATTLTDNLAKLSQRIFTEATTLTDSFLATVQIVFTEAVTITDLGITRIMTFFYTETVTLTDIINRLANRLFVEATSLSDVFAYVHTKYASLVEVVTTTDVMMWLEQRILTEATTISATFISLRIRMGNFTEAITSTDTLGRTISHVLTETVAIVDILTKLLARAAFLEAITTTDTIIKLAQRVFAEATTMTDTVLKMANHVMTEAVVLSDQLIMMLNGIVTNLWAKVARTVDTWIKQIRN